LNTWSDKTILYFIFARRHDLEAIKFLIRNHISKCKELGFDKMPPTFKDVEKNFRLNPCNVVIKGVVDKYERLVVYYRMQHEIAKAIPFHQKYAILFWETFYRCDLEPIKYLRNGIIILVDFEGFGFKNLDLSTEAKEFYHAMTGIFPRRIRSIYVVNGGPILKFALKAGKLVLSKKIMKRISSLDKKGVKDLIPDKFLLKEYGGSCNISFNDSVKQILEEDGKRMYNNNNNNISNTPNQNFVVAVTTPVNNSNSDNNSGTSSNSNSPSSYSNSVTDQ